jgi:hypothetical protein
MISSRPVDTGQEAAGPDPQPTWTWKNALAALFCCTVLALQIAVPLVQLATPRPARFGWHMWSARRKLSRFLVVTRDGTTRPADLAAHVVFGRGEMDLDTALPPHLCRVVPDAAAVEIRSPGRDVARVHSCR